MFRNRGYATKIFTKDRIPYYVKSDFATEYPPDGADRRKVESQVRSEHIENLRINCYQETLNGTLNVKSRPGRSISRNVFLGKKGLK